MRPKKRILLVDENEDRRSELRFVLETSGFHVELSEDAERDLAIAHWPICWAAAKRLKEQSPLIVIGASESTPTFGGADVVLSDSARRYLLLEHIRSLSAKKRGPKKRQLEVPAVPVEVHELEAVLL